MWFNAWAKNMCVLTKLKIGDLEKRKNKAERRRAREKESVVVCMVE